MKNFIKILAFLVILAPMISTSNVEIRCPDVYRDHVDEEEIILKLKNLLEKKPTHVDKV